MNTRFNVIYSLVAMITGYITFFVVSDIPVIEYFSLALSVWLVQLGFTFTLKDPAVYTIFNGLTALIGVSVGYYLWGWSLLIGGLAMSGVGLALAIIWGLMFWYTEHQTQS